MGRLCSRRHRAGDSSTGFSVGEFVRVLGMGLGTLELDNGDGSWNVGLEDGRELDVPSERLRHLAAVAGGARIVLDPSSEPKPEGWTRFVCFSDTHGMHDEIRKEHIVEADVLLHAGDFTNTGELKQVKSLALWLQNYPARHKVVIAGNHDITFQPAYYEKSWRRFHGTPFDCEEVRRALLGSGCCLYLEDELAEVAGYRIYGSPWQPEFCDWAFNLPDDGEALKSIWQRVPTDVDVLLTHSPARHRADLCSHGGRAGCAELKSAIEERAVPVSVVGHIHESYGSMTDGVTLFVNASTCTHDYFPTNPPVVFDVPPPDQLRAATNAAAAAAGEH